MTMLSEPPLPRLVPFGQWCGKQTCRRSPPVSCAQFCLPVWQRCRPGGRCSGLRGYDHSGRLLRDWSFDHARRPASPATCASFETPLRPFERPLKDGTFLPAGAERLCERRVWRRIGHPRGRSSRHSCLAAETALRPALDLRRQLARSSRQFSLPSRRGGGRRTRRAVDTQGHAAGYQHWCEARGKAESNCPRRHYPSLVAVKPPGVVSVSAYRGRTSLTTMSYAGAHNAGHQLVA